jgi:signal transduction histidine kinase
LEGRVLGVMAVFSRQVISDTVLADLGPIAGAIAQWIRRTRAEQALRESERKLAGVNADLEKKVEERTAKLRETVQELEAFSYSIAHDMRAPLRAMQGYAKILSQEFPLNETGQVYLSRIRNSANRLDQLIQDVLNYSKVIRGDIPITSVDTGKLLQDILTSYPNLQRPDVRIEVKGDMPVVQGNPAALTQVFSNLLDNAVKFVKPGVEPRVTIAAQPVPENASAVRISIQDNGIGIHEKALRRMFQMFQRLNPADYYEGTGIGLAIVRKAVERMGGSVGVESTVGRGSTFWIELQRAG